MTRSYYETEARDLPASPVMQHRFDAAPEEMFVRGYGVDLRVGRKGLKGKETPGC